MTSEEKRAYQRKWYAANRDRVKASRTAYDQAHRSEAVDRTRAWRKANPERRRQLSANWRATHPDYAAAYHKANAEKIRAKVREWRKENPDRYRELSRAYTHRRRVRLQNGIVEMFGDLDVFIRDGWVCGLCHESISPDLRFPDRMSPSLDHIIPVAHGGTHTLNNVQASHLGCNMDKGATIQTQEGAA